MIVVASCDNRHIEARLRGVAALRGASLPLSGVASGAALRWQSVHSHGVEHELPSPGASVGRGRWSRIFLIFVPVLLGNGTGERPCGVQVSDSLTSPRAELGILLPGSVVTT
ncbi:hypothetical protein MRX96_018493 [Rhipicephalus microplus]